MLGDGHQSIFHRDWYTHGVWIPMVRWMTINHIKSFDHGRVEDQYVFLSQLPMLTAISSNQNYEYSWTFRYSQVVTLFTYVNGLVLLGKSTGNSRFVPNQIWGFPATYFPFCSNPLNTTFPYIPIHSHMEVSWVMGAPQVIIHFERWDFNKNQNHPAIYWGSPWRAGNTHKNSHDPTKGANITIEW